MSAALDIAGRHHNRPPEPILDERAPMPSDAERFAPDIFAEQVAIDYAEHAKTRDELIAGFARFMVRYSTLPRYAPAELPAIAKQYDLAIVEISPEKAEAVQFDGRDWIKLLGPQFVRILPTVVIPNAEVAAKANSFIKQIKDTCKAINKIRDATKRIYDGASDVIQAYFKAGILDPLENAWRALEQGPYLAYTNRVIAEERAARDAAAKRAREEAEKALAAAEKTNHADILDNAVVAADLAEKAAARAAAPVSEMGRTRGALGGVGTVLTNWKYEITDRAKVPDEYWVIDEKKLAAAVKAIKDTAEIPGVRIFPERGVSVR